MAAQLSPLVRDALALRSSALAARRRAWELRSDTVRIRLEIADVRARAWRRPAGSGRRTG